MKARGEGEIIGALYRMGVYHKMKGFDAQSWASHAMIPPVICTVSVRVFASVAVHAHCIAGTARMIWPDRGFVIGFCIGLGSCLAGGVGVGCVGFANRTIREGWFPGSYLGCPSAVLVIRGRRSRGRRGRFVILSVGGSD